MRGLTTISLITIVALTAGTYLTAVPTGTVFLRGDVNGDSKVDQMDIEAFQMHLAAPGQISAPVLEALDLLDDGRIDPKDLDELYRQIGEGVAGNEWDFLEFQFGDVTKDGKVDARDYYQLREVVYFGGQVRSDMDAADLSNDGRINATDLQFMRHLLRGRR